MPPPRLFAKRAPTTPSSSSSSSSSGENTHETRQHQIIELKVSPSPPQPRKRPRLAARVISQHTHVKQTLPRAQALDFSEPEANEAKGSTKLLEIIDEKEEELRFSNQHEEKGDGGKEESEEESEDESEDDIEEDELSEEENQQSDIVRPIFISREKRQLKYDDEKEESAAWSRAAQREEERRKETRRIVEDILQEEECNKSDWMGRKDEMLPDDEDREEDREREFVLWRVRELKRILRDKEELDEWRRKRSGEKEERNGDEARGSTEGEDANNDENEQMEKRRPAFLQKYYKMGPFFLERGDDGRFVEDVYNRDYNQGTNEDVINRKVLPTPMQVRRGEFGKAGRSKYTHLAKEDTAASLANELRRDKELKEALEGTAKRQGN